MSGRTQNPPPATSHPRPQDAELESMQKRLQGYLAAASPAVTTHEVILSQVQPMVAPLSKSFGHEVKFFAPSSALDKNQTDAVELNLLALACGAWDGARSGEVLAEVLGLTMSLAAWLTPIDNCASTFKDALALDGFSGELLTVENLWSYNPTKCTRAMMDSEVLVFKEVGRPQLLCAVAGVCLTMIGKDPSQMSTKYLEARVAAYVGALMSHVEVRPTFLIDLNLAKVITQVFTMAANVRSMIVMALLKRKKRPEAHMSTTANMLEMYLKGSKMTIFALIAGLIIDRNAWLMGIACLKPEFDIVEKALRALRLEEIPHLYYAKLLYLEHPICALTPRNLPLLSSLAILIARSVSPTMKSYADGFELDRIALAIFAQVGSSIVYDGQCIIVDLDDILPTGKGTIRATPTMQNPTQIV